MAEHQFNTPPSTSGYAKGCRCDACRNAKRAVQTKWKRAHREEVRAYNRAYEQRRAPRRRGKGRKPRTALPLPIGTRFGQLTTTQNPEKISGVTFVACRCDCGREKRVRFHNLIRGASKSCGHNAGPARQPFSRKITRVVWKQIQRRCYDTKHPSYPRYGGRGITVCDQWLQSFEVFYDDMGARPSTAHSIDRKNGEGNYEPDNCRWATIEVQNNNTRRNLFLTLQNETLTAAQWDRRMGYRLGTISGRLQSGWSAERAIKTPVRVHFSHK